MKNIVIEIGYMALSTGMSLAIILVIAFISEYSAMWAFLGLLTAITMLIRSHFPE